MFNQNTGQPPVPQAPAPAAAPAPPQIAPQGGGINPLMLALLSKSMNSGAPGGAPQGVGGAPPPPAMPPMGGIMGTLGGGQSNPGGGAVGAGLAGLAQGGGSLAGLLSGTPQSGSPYMEPGSGIPGGVAGAPQPQGQIIGQLGKFWGRASDQPPGAPGSGSIAGGNAESPTSY